MFYALPAYGCAEVSSLNKLTLLQKKAIRLVTNSRYNSHTDPLFKTTNVMKFDDMVQFVKIDFMHSYCHKYLPASFDNVWTQNCEIDADFNLNLRNYLHFRVPFTRLHFSDRLPLHSFPKLYNSLETEMLVENCKKKFKSKLKALFMDKLPETVRCSNPFCNDCYSNNELVDLQL